MNAPVPLHALQPALSAEQTGAIREFADRTWDDEIVPALTDYIAIPAKSPMFDAQWREHGHIERVVREAAPMQTVGCQADRPPIPDKFAFRRIF